MRMFLECGHERIFISNMLSVEQWEKKYFLCLSTYFVVIS